MQQQAQVFKTGLRSRIRIFSGLIISALLTIPLIAILLYVVNVDDTIICTGTVIPEHTYELAAPFDGPVQEIFFRTGDAVKQGDLIVQMDDTEYRNEIQKITASIHILKSELQVKKSDLALQLDVTEIVHSVDKVKAAIQILKASLQVKKNDLEVLKLDPLPESFRHALPRLEAARESADMAQRNIRSFKDVLTKIEFVKYETEARNAKVELAIREENAKIVNSGLGAKIIEKAEGEVRVIEQQIAEKEVELAILNAQIQDRSSAVPVKNNHGSAQKIREKAENEMRVIEQQIAEKEVELVILSKKIADCKIRAFVDGTILELPCKQKRYAEKGQPAVIMGSPELTVLAEVDSRFIRKVRIGQDAEISSDIFSRLQYGHFYAVVQKISSVPLDGTTKYPVYLRLNTEECDIKVGSKAEVRIITGSAPAIYAFLNITEEDETMKRLQENRKKNQSNNNNMEGIRK